jgi:N-acetylneuraminate synthase/N,N'-diacetyllegionaminate synthase
VSTVRVGGHTLGGGAPCFVIAEAGVNHNGDPALAARLVDVAADAGADAVKFQTFRSEALTSRHAPKATYQVETTGGNESQLAMLKKLELSLDAHRDLIARCRQRKIMFLSSVFDEASADALDALDVAAFKLGSGELTNLPLLERLARTRRPLLVSTGMATLAEVEAAVAAIARHGAPVALFHCVSAYPAPAAEMNLRAMDTLRARFGCPVGLSDHTLGWEIALAAVARGAEMLEKHFTLDATLPGPDHRASLEPDALAALVRGVRAVESALGDGIKRPTPAEENTKAVARKSVVVTRAIARGTRLGAADLTVKRPGTGIPPSDLAKVVGRSARRDLEADQPLGWDDLA